MIHNDFPNFSLFNFINEHQNVFLSQESCTRGAAIFDTRAGFEREFHSDCILSLVSVRNYNVHSRNAYPIRIISYTPHNQMDCQSVKYKNYEYHHNVKHEMYLILVYIEFSILEFCSTRRNGGIRH